MADSPDLTPAKRQQHAERKKRLARALRENLHRRKQQARAQQEGAAGRTADRTADDPPA
jgi:hypothetical protein